MICEIPPAYWQAALSLNAPGSVRSLGSDVVGMAYHLELRLSYVTRIEGTGFSDSVPSLKSKSAASLL